MNNLCTFYFFYCSIKLSAIPSHVKSLHEGLCNHWLFEWAITYNKKSSRAKLWSIIFNKTHIILWSPFNIVVVMLFFRVSCSVTPQGKTTQLLDLVWTRHSQLGWVESRFDLRTKKNSKNTNYCTVHLLHE